MPLDDKAIEELFNNKEEIVVKLEELLKNKASSIRKEDIEQIYEKAKDLEAKTINGLGVVLDSNLAKDEKEEAIKFFKLAANKGCDWGCNNYADSILGQNLKEALKYARKAVEYTKGKEGHDKHEHKYILYKALEKNNKPEKAKEALIDYLEYCCKGFNEPKKPDELDNLLKHISNLKEKSKECKERFEEIKKEIEIEIENESLVNLFMIKIHRNLGEDRKAWRLYCSFDQKSCLYEYAIKEAKQLIIEGIKQGSILQSPSSLTISNNNQETVVKSSEEQSTSSTTPQDMFLCNFSKSWKKESKWFHSVDRAAIDDKYKGHIQQIESLITIKEEEIQIYNTILGSKDIKNDNLIKDKLEKLEEELDQLQDSKEEFEKNITSECLPETREAFRRHKAESRFFDPGRSKKRSEIIDLVKKIIDHRYQLKDPDECIDLTGKSARLVITAERLFQEKVIDLSNNDKPELGIPSCSQSNYSESFMSFGPFEKYKVDGTEIEFKHRTEPHPSSSGIPPSPQRLGAGYLKDIGSYNAIYNFFKKLTNQEKEKEKKLAGLMIEYAKSHKSITLDELRKIYKDASADDTNCLNRCCFLIMEKEQVQWYSATYLNRKELHLGMSVAQARCLIMIREGFLSFEETFKNNVPFGVYSHTSILADVKKVEESCKKIEDLYKVYLQSNKHVEDHMKFSKKCITKKTNNLTCVLTREQAHEDLKEVYGGGSDTSGEEYSTDLSVSPCSSVDSLELEKVEGKERSP